MAQYDPNIEVKKEYYLPNWFNVTKPFMFDFLCNTVWGLHKPSKRVVFIGFNELEIKYLYT